MTTTTQPTIAEQISDRFNNDGQCFEDSDGQTFESVCDSQRGYDCLRPRIVNDQNIVWRFSDDSYLGIAQTDCWDVLSVAPVWGERTEPSDNGQTLGLFCSDDYASENPVAVSSDGWGWVMP